VLAALLVGWAGAGWGGEAEQLQLLVAGRVIWEGVPWLPGGGVSCARDPRFAQLVASAPLAADGHFVLLLPPGRYYLRAVVDLDADGKLSAGDGLGFYGVRAMQDRPAELAVAPESQAALVHIAITFQYQPDGRLRKALTGPEAGMAVATGRLEGAQGPAYVLLWPLPPARFGFAAPVASEGSFTVRALAGDYLVLAAADANSDGLLQPNEPAACWQDDQGRARVLRLYPQSTAGLGTLGLSSPFKRPGQVVRGAEELPWPLTQWPALVFLKLAAPPAQPCASQVFLFADPQLRNLFASTWLLPEMGLVAPPANYYLLAVFDLNHDARLGEGDLLATVGAQKKAGAVSWAPGSINEVVLERSEPLTPQLLSEAQLEEHGP
jgi:hypothetical protein